MRQLLRKDHFAYTITFIQAKITALDKATKSNDEGETVEFPSSTPTTDDELVTHIYLGSRKKATTVSEFAGSSAENGLTYSVFRRMLENFLNKQLPQERYLKIQGDQKVKCPNFYYFG